MVHKKVNIARVQTMADGGIRLVIDLLGGNSEDIKEAFALMTQDITMILIQSSNLEESNENNEIVSVN